MKITSDDKAAYELSLHITKVTCIHAEDTIPGDVHLTKADCDK
jgi:hypothetical protein